jgi:hypothetical protein
VIAIGYNYTDPSDAPSDPLAAPPVIPGASPALVQALAAAWPSLSLESRAAAHRQADEIRHALRVVSIVARVGFAREGA